MWQTLFNDSVNVEHALGGIKRTFTEVRCHLHSECSWGTGARVRTWVRTVRVRSWVPIPALTAAFFTQITRSEIMNYRSQLEEFARRFYKQGPGAVGEDLDKGEAVVWGC